jgi:hypothetical protein
MTAVAMDQDERYRWEATNQAAVHLWYEQTFGFAVPPLTSSADGVNVDYAFKEIPPE